MNANDRQDAHLVECANCGNKFIYTATVIDNSDDLREMLRQQQAEIEVNKYGYELDINIKIEELKEKDVCLKLLMDKICQQQAEIEALKAELDDIKQYNMDRNLSE